MSDEHHESTCYGRKVHSIGNLTLLNPSDNGIQLDAFPWEDEKVANYSGSDLRLNLTLVSPENWQTLQPDVKSQLTSVVSQYFQSTVTWGEKEIDSRAELYWNLILKDFKQNLTLRN